MVFYRYLSDTTSGEGSEIDVRRTRFEQVENENCLSSEQVTQRLVSQYINQQLSDAGFTTQEQINSSYLGKLISIPGFNFADYSGELLLSLDGPLGKIVLLICVSPLV